MDCKPASNGPGVTPGELEWRTRPGCMETVIVNYSVLGVPDGHRKYQNKFSELERSFIIV